ncbi:TIGR01777 family oxidoreductase [[Flexibacter] sp. ATCC 35208]|uniref:TIGR01777 family oxidoreductase n=1 Tax=[Flexibacter] sp. ATCC 35208 TaxID=1936242 RepID=UPI0009CD55EF|nr:TIGR01777 family oxidoreductase [[Flexibacter] sp. ATCC 35208]OMP81218.1 TIGR01777 family protein [[Flexibacter] sp. ATCC 35208]
MKNKKIIIAGGTGFIGTGLTHYFGHDNDIIILTRHPLPDHDRVTYAAWDGKSLGNWVHHFENADLLINLTGKSVNCRYTPENKQAIFDSRTNATDVIAAAFRSIPNPPKVWINAASATIYRHAEDHPMDEFNGEIENDFSVQVCKKWEAGFNEATVPAGVRKAVLRIAVTIGAEGGVIFPYLNLVKFGLGGYQGSGQQRFSWVHLTDVARMMEWIYENPTLEGTFNCCAPHPTTNREFMRTLRKAAGHLFGLPAPTWMLKIGACLIGTETELLLKSRWVLPTRATQAGFTFQYPHLKPAMENIIHSLPRRRYHLFY